MEKKLLLPHCYKLVGWGLLVGAIVLWVLSAILNKEFSFLQTKMFAIVNGGFSGESEYFSIVDIDLTLTLIGSFFIIGGLLVAFSSEKVEDEFIMKMRLSSFKWAVLLSYLILLVLFLFVHGFFFMWVIFYNMFTVLILFILHFNYLLLRNRIWS